MGALANQDSWEKCQPTFGFVPVFIEKTRDVNVYIMQYTNMAKLCSAVVTWDKFGWWELYRVLVSTCSGTKP